MAGQKYPVDRVVMMNFKIDGINARRFKELVDKEGLTVSEALRTIVERYVKLKGNLLVKQ